MSKRKLIKFLLKNVKSFMPKGNGWELELYSNIIAIKDEETIKYLRKELTKDTL